MIVQLLRPGLMAFVFLLAIALTVCSEDRESESIQVSLIAARRLERLDSEVAQLILRARYHSLQSYQGLVECQRRMRRLGDVLAEVCGRLGEEVGEEAATVTELVRRKFSGIESFQRANAVLVNSMRRLAPTLSAVKGARGSDPVLVEELENLTLHAHELAAGRWIDEMGPLMDNLARIRAAHPSEADTPVSSMTEVLNSVFRYSPQADQAMGLALASNVRGPLYRLTPELQKRQLRATRRSTQVRMLAGGLFVLGLLMCVGMVARLRRQTVDLKVDNEGLAARERERTVELEHANGLLTDALQRAQSADKAKSEFLANMSHEIRTPMTAILGFTDLLTEGPQTEEERQGHIATIRRNGQALLHLINEILDLSRVESGQMTLENIETSPAQIASDVCEVLRVRADAGQVDLRLWAEGPVPETMHTDPTRIRQILTNLIGNAIKFSDGGIVRVKMVVETVDAKRRLRFSVSDQGPGIAADRLGPIFEPFTQSDSSTTRTHGGSGLGLAICRKLCDLLAGELWADSVLGVGSTFHFALPLEDATRLVPLGDGVEDRDVAPAESGPVSTGRVLFVDDGPDNRVLVATILRRAGHQVDLATNGEEGVEAVLRAWNEGEAYDVVLMDMLMPVLDGYEATRRLRAVGYSGVVIALTANALVTDREKCLQVGCSDFATKPVDARLLLTQIDRHLRDSGCV